MRFSDYDLQVITIEKTTSDYSMTVNKNFVTFSKAIAAELNYPSHVIVAFNKDTKVMGIQVCHANTKGSYEFCKSKKVRKGVVQMMNKNLKEAILTIMPDWESGKRYKVPGIYIAEDRAFVFELKGYEVLKPYRKES